jgi:hypothetical protein
MDGRAYRCEVAAMSDLTASLVVISDYLFNLLDVNKEDLGLEAVFYGDQEKFPVTPAACIEPDEKPRELKSAQRMTRVEFNVYVLLYYGKIESPQTNRRDSDILAERVEALIHSKRSLDGLVIHGMITSLTSGYVVRDGSLLRASRLTYNAQSQELLPQTG